MIVPPTAMHEFAEVQSTALRLVSLAPATFGVGDTVHAAEAAEGVSNKAVVANRTRRTDRSDICPSTYASGQGGSSAASALSALDVSNRIAEDGHLGTARRCEDPRKRRFGREAAIPTPTAELTGEQLANKLPAAH